MLLLTQVRRNLCILYYLEDFMVRGIDTIGAQHPQTGSTSVSCLTSFTFLSFSYFYHSHCAFMMVLARRLFLARQTNLLTIYWQSIVLLFVFCFASVTRLTRQTNPIESSLSRRVGSSLSRLLRCVANPDTK